MKDKKGVTLITLSLVVIVLIMISGIITYMSVNTVVETKLTTLGKDMTEVKDKIEEYYMINGSMPYKSDETAIDYETYIDMISENKGKNDLEGEATSNDDLGEVFHFIDLSLLGIDEISLGTGIEGNDYFLITENSQNIYYLKGKKIGTKYYFSLNNILNKD